MAKVANKHPNQKAKRGKSAKGVKPSKVFIYALALAALGGGGYLVYDRLKRRNYSNQDLIDPGVDNTTPERPGSYIPPPSGLVSRPASGDNFPLKRGSRGPRVKLLQQALAKTNPALIADGIFGPKTSSALKAMGYAEVINEAAFNKITGNTGSGLRVVFNPLDLAVRLYRAAQDEDIDTVLSILTQINTVEDYSSVNAHYKKQGFIISRTIVTDLLDYAFKNDEPAKERIRNEFLRMGLKTDDSGKWSLQGFPLYKDIITIRQTIVTDSRNNKIPVGRNTILGDEIRISNGMTWFRSIDNSILKVPTRDIKYT